MFIIDPPGGRPTADEMVLVMGDINNQQRNALYASMASQTTTELIQFPIYQNQLVRLYLLNMIEFDPASFHIHANMFRVYRTGRTLTPRKKRM